LQHMLRGDIYLDYRVRYPRKYSTMTIPHTRNFGHTGYPERILEKRSRTGQTDIHSMNCYSRVYSVV